MPKSRQTDTRRARRRSPRSPSNPEDTTSRARTPARPHARAAAITAEAGSAITARSIASGASSIAASACEAVALTGAGADRVDGPAIAGAEVRERAPPRRRRGGSVAPSSAMLRGASTWRTAATAVRRSRSSKARAPLRGDRRGQSHGDLAGLRTDVDGKAAVPEDVDHRVVVGQHHRVEGGDAAFRGIRGELLQEQRRQPPFLPRVRDRERDLGGVAVDADPHRVRHDRSAARRPPRRARAPRPPPGPRSAPPGAGSWRRRRSGTRGPRRTGLAGRRGGPPRRPGAAAAHGRSRRPAGRRRPSARCRARPSWKSCRIGRVAAPEGPTTARATVVSRTPVPRTTGGCSVPCR